MRRAVILGGSGFIGGFLVERLVGEQVEVISVGRRPRPRRSDAVRHVVLDVCEDQSGLERLIAEARPDWIVDLLGGRGQDPIALLRVAHRLITVLADLDLDATLLLSGSAAEYGHPGSLPVDESHPVRPASAYGFARALQFWMARSLYEQTGRRIVIARLFNVIGPGQSEAFVTGAIVRQAVGVAAGRMPFVEIGRIDAVRDFVDARDVARALILLASRGSAGQVYNICGGRPVRVEDLLRKVGGVCGLSDAFFVVRPERVADDVAAIYGDYGKLAADTGWRPEIELDRSLADMVAFERSGRRVPVPGA